MVRGSGSRGINKGKAEFNQQSAGDIFSLEIINFESGPKKVTNH